MALITIAQADRHLRLSLMGGDASPPDYSDDPRLPDVELKMTQAEALVLDYLKVDGDPDGSPALWTERQREVVQCAVLLALQAIYDDDEKRTLGDYMAPGGVITLLLARLRTPALA